MVERQSLDPSQPLDSQKCERFCAFIISGQSAQDAYELAGYTPDRRKALRLRARPEVDARINCLMAQKPEAVADVKAEIKQAKVTPQWVMARLAENVEVCLGRRAAPDGTYTYNPQAANRALELLGNELGMFEGESKPPPPEEPIDKYGVFDDERMLAMFARWVREKRAARLRESGYDESGNRNSSDGLLTRVGRDRLPPKK